MYTRTAGHRHQTWKYLLSTQSSIHLITITCLSKQTLPSSYTYNFFIHIPTPSLSHFVSFTLTHRLSSSFHCLSLFLSVPLPTSLSRLLSLPHCHCHCLSSWMIKHYQGVLSLSVPFSPIWLDFTSSLLKNKRKGHMMMGYHHRNRSMRNDISSAWFYFFFRLIGKHWYMRPMLRCFQPARWILRGLP